MPLGGEPIKYEMDKEAGTLFVDRFLHTSMRYPGNYGFVPHTLSEDGDPIDVLVCNTRALVPGCVINVRPIGVLVMEDNAGQDEKIIAVPSPQLTRRYENVNEYTHLPDITLHQVQHFFEHYKDLEARQMGQDRRLGRRRSRAARDIGRDRARSRQELRAVAAADAAADVGEACCPPNRTSPRSGPSRSRPTAAVASASGHGDPRRCDRGCP